MAKKFGKVLLFAAAVGSAVGAAYYFLRKRDNLRDISEEEDYDDLIDDADESSDTCRSYVPLNTDTADDESACGDSCREAEEDGQEEKKDSFIPLAQTMESAEEHVEEFFDEDEVSNEEPPIDDN